MRLGKLIEELEKQPPGNHIYFDISDERGVCSPYLFTSYRGYYDQLAVTKYSGTTVFVRDFLSQARNCVGRIFEGYKGGEYTMDETTPVWVSDHGCCDSIKIVRIHSPDDRKTIIETFEDDY